MKITTTPIEAVPTPPPPKEFEITLRLSSEEARLLTHAYCLTEYPEIKDIFDKSHHAYGDKSITVHALSSLLSKIRESLLTNGASI